MSMIEAQASPAVAETNLGTTESVCPACLARVPAFRIGRGDDVYLRKTCPDHGTTETIVWRGAPSFASWARPRTPAAPRTAATAVDRGCPFDCGLCPDHRQQSCCVLLEVTSRCDLRCPFCFASSGGRGTEVPLEALERTLRRLMADAGPVNLQLSGGEPCIRDDLPAVASVARSIGFDFIQVNTNGLRLATDPTLAFRLREAGVSTVFLQFDGIDDEVYVRIRGRGLLARKLEAIEHCAEAGLGVVLVPVIVPGVNDGQLGEIVRLGLDHQPTVRGVHFQPVSYFGRYPTAPADADRITLPEIIAGLERQTGGLINVGNFQPAGAENALCSFNGSFVSMPDGRLIGLTRPREAVACCSGAAAPSTRPDRRPATVGGSARARDFVARTWSPGASPSTSSEGGTGGSVSRGPSFGEWDVFLARSRTHSFTISGMAFQDAWTLDVERLRDCHINIADGSGLTVPFCAYNLTDRNGRSLYRQPAGLGRLPVAAATAER